MAKKKENPKTATGAMIEARDEAYQEKVEQVAEQVKLLFSFCFQLVPDLDILKKVSKLSGERVSTAMAMAPILGAQGMDYEEVEFETRLKAKRADALVNLIQVLEETEKERMVFADKQKARAQGRADISKMLGL